MHVTDSQTDSHLSVASTALASVAQVKKHRKNGYHDVLTTGHIRVLASAPNFGSKYR